MMTFPPPIFRRRRGRTKRPMQAPVALVLVGAEYLAGTWVQLTFDRAIDAGGLVGSQVVVDDTDERVRYQALSTPTMIGPATVRMPVESIGSSDSPTTVLTAGAGTGIVAVDDPGMSALELPFP